MTYTRLQDLLQEQRLDLDISQEQSSTIKACKELRQQSLLQSLLPMSMTSHKSIDCVQGKEGAAANTEPSAEEVAGSLP